MLRFAIRAQPRHWSTAFIAFGLLAFVAAGAAAIVSSFRYAAAAATPAPIPATGRPLVTAIVDVEAWGGPNAQAAFARARRSGARAVRLLVDWSSVAPGGTTPPQNFHADDPRDIQYHWRIVDLQVERAVLAGLIPIVDVYNAPAWAATGRKTRGDDGPVDPSAKDFGEFAKAIAQRYSGSFKDLPRVRYWEVWNEPNVSLYLMPQYQHGHDAAAAVYRNLVNAFADAVHGVHSDNVVAAGEVSPFTVRNAAVDTVGPLAFMRDVLCVSTEPDPRPTCNARVRFDVWTVHPYTSGDATHHALNPNDLSLGDLPKLRPILAAAERLGHLKSDGPVGIWVTEFSWDTNPPDPRAVPIALQSRWTAEALYRMWQNGVTLATWFTLRDGPLKTSDFQSGLFFRGPTWSRDRPKPTYTAFRFPFVAYLSAGRLTYWGRTPTSKPGPVAIEAVSGSGERLVAVAHANQFGIFRGNLRGGSLSRRASLEAQYGSSASLPFSLTRPPDRAVTPFGVGTVK